MKLRLTTSLEVEDVLAPLVAELTRQGVEVSRQAQTTSEFSLYYNSAELSSEEVHQLMRTLSPLQPALIPRAREALGEADAELHLGAGSGWSEYTLKLHCDSEAALARAEALVASFGLSAGSPTLQLVERNRMEFGGTPAVYRQLILWKLSRAGMPVVEHKRWEDGDRDVYLYLRDPGLEGVGVSDRFAIELHVDDLDVGQRVLDETLAGGFSRAQLHYRAGLAADQPRFRVVSGPLGQESSSRALSRLRALLEDLLEREGVDPVHFPLQVESGEGIVTRVELPLAAFAAGELVPYAGGHPRSFAIEIASDNMESAEPLAESLRQLGFDRVTTVPLPDGVSSFSLKQGLLAEYPLLSDQVRGMVERVCLDHGVVSELECAVGEDAESAQVQISLPLDAHRSGDLERRVIAAAAEYNVKVRCLNEALRRRVIADLNALGSFASMRGESDDFSGTPQIAFGGAPRALIRLIRDELPYDPDEVTLDKRWGDDDRDIWIDLPPPAEEDPGHDLRASAADVTIDLDRWLTGAAPELPASAASEAAEAAAEPAAAPEPTAERPLIALEGERLRVGEVELRRRAGDRHPLAPSLEAFAHYTIDDKTAATLVHVATSAALREPCLLEGETSTSKTSSVLYLAALLGQPVVRLNLNGQTDTGELIGRYVPDDREAEPGEAGHPWRWQDGLVLQAISHGWWVVLDEVNLAEPQILERLNSLLEREPSLVLSEYDNSVWGSDGKPIHADFRLFATMNPAEYAGRSELSPAYRDRWLGYRFAPSPGEREYLAMLRHLVFGQQPEVGLAGRRYAGVDREPPLAGLAAIEPIDSFLRALARFHAALEHACRRDGADGQGLGRHRRERYVFTRRSLLGLLEYLQREAPRDEAGEPLARVLRLGLMRYYVQRVTPGEDRKLMLQLLDAAGIGPQTWSFESPGGESRLELTAVGPNAIDVVRALRRRLGCSLAEAKRLLAQVPVALGGPQAQGEAQQFAAELEAAGATVQLSEW